MLLSQRFYRQDTSGSDILRTPPGIKESAEASGFFFQGTKREKARTVVGVTASLLPPGPTPSHGGCDDGIKILSLSLL